MSRLWNAALAVALLAGAPFTPRTPDVARAACDPAPPGMVSSWQAEGDYLDCNGLKDGTEVGSVPFAPGKIGQAFSFFANDANYVDLGDPTSLKFTDAITISAWIYPTGAPDPGNLRAILVKWGQRFTPPENLEDSYGLWTENGSGGNLQIFGAVNLDPLGGDPIEPHVDGGTIPLNAWSHVAMTFYRSPTDVNFAVYVNCALVSSAAIGDHPILASDQRVLIGREDSYQTRPFVGLIDQVRVFDRALTAQEISEMALAADPHLCDTLSFQIACAGDTVVDAKGSATLTYTITNTGNVADNYAYDITDNAGWITPGSGATGPLAPGAAFPINVGAFGPADCNPSSDVVTFFVRSVGSPDAPQSCTTTLTCSPVNVDKTLVSDRNPSTCGDKVTFTNTLSQLDATGTVTFYDGSDPIVTVPVVDGVATLSIATLTVGTHSITSAYSGDGGHLPVTSNKIDQVVNPIPTTTTLTGDPNPSFCGQKVTLTVHVDPTTATGQVILFGDATGSATLVNGEATFSLVLGTGVKSFGAYYAGDGCHSASQSGKLEQVTVPGPTTTTLTSDPNPSMCEQKVTLTARVNPPGATGTVNFFDSTAAIGSAPVVNGAATLSLPTLANGTHSFYAVYKGDDCMLASESDKIAHSHDCPTATLLSLFQAEPKSGAIELRWRFADPGAFVEVRVERSLHPAGPWTAVNAEIRDAAGVTTAIDRGVEAGRSYWYKLVARPAQGSPMEFGPLAATAGNAPGRFELSAASPNPSPGNTRIGFAVARESNIRLSILDVAGREVAVLAQGTHAAGQYQAMWSGQTTLGAAPVGLYFVRYQYPGNVLVERLVLAR